MWYLRFVGFVFLQIIYISVVGTVFIVTSNAGYPGAALLLVFFGFCLYTLYFVARVMRRRREGQKWRDEVKMQRAKVADIRRILNSSEQGRSPTQD